MGSPSNEPARLTNEGPQTLVTLSEGFWMSRYEVTQREYLAVMGANPSLPGDLENPVEAVDWEDAMAYCRALTAKERDGGNLPAGYEYRLPTEAQWEYACRAGTTTAFHDGPALRSGMANFFGKFEYPPCGPNPPLYCVNLNSFETEAIDRPVPVGSYAPNAWGLYDMHGNVQEWCLDSIQNFLPGGHVTDPRGPEPPNCSHAIRGGSWYILSGIGWYCRSARRTFGPCEGAGHEIGFRVVLVRVP